MSFDTSVRMIPGRKSIAGANLQRGAIEATCTAGISLRRIAFRFNVGIMAVHRH
jgi:hypothetical protein